MDSEVTYPYIKKYSIGRMVVMTIFRWIFIIAALSCIAVNICVGWPAWSAVAAAGLWWVWTQFIDTDIANYNRISQFVKAIEYICVLLIIINIVFSLDWNHWINFIFPFVIFPALIVLAVLLFSDFRKQKHNIMPLISFNVYCLAGSIVVLCINGEWPVIVLLCVSAALFIASIATMRLDILKEFKRYFSMK